MSMETNAHDAAPSVYINLLAAHMTLVRMRDHLRMVSSVVDAMVDAEAEITIGAETFHAELPISLFRKLLLAHNRPFPQAGHHLLEENHSGHAAFLRWRDENNIGRILGSQVDA